MIEEGSGDAEADRIFESNGNQAVRGTPIDSARYLVGAEVDFVDNLMGGVLHDSQPERQDDLWLRAVVRCVVALRFPTGSLSDSRH